MCFVIFAKSLDGPLSAVNVKKKMFPSVKEGLNMIWSDSAYDFSFSFSFLFFAFFLIFYLMQKVTVLKLVNDLEPHLTLITLPFDAL